MTKEFLYEQLDRLNNNIEFKLNIQKRLLNYLTNCNQVNWQLENLLKQEMIS